MQSQSQSKSLPGIDKPDDGDAVKRTRAMIRGGMTVKDACNASYDHARAMRNEAVAFLSRAWTTLDSVAATATDAEIDTLFNEYEFAVREVTASQIDLDEVLDFARAHGTGNTKRVKRRAA